jgi:hypothetical protein
MTPTESRDLVIAFLQRHPGVILPLEDDDGRSATLFERLSGKRLSLKWADLKEVVERASPLRPQPYLLLLWHDERQVALADVGFAFAPSTQNTGPLPELPEVFCFRDLRHLLGGAQSLLEEEGRELEALRAIMMSIALIDGARAVGFEVSRDERQLEALLGELEKRGVK